MTNVQPAWVKGGHFGLEFPTNVENLLTAGPDFLTRAMHAAGTLPADNAVTAITAHKEFFGGGMGRKLCLSVGYARADTALHTELFAKFTREFGDPLLALFGPLMESEVRFALLSRQPNFPAMTPRCYFADYSADPLCGLLITEKIAYGVAPILPPLEKAMDWQLAHPLPYYHALIDGAATLAGSHRSGRLGADVDRQFPFDASIIDPGSRIPYEPGTLAAQLNKLRDFAATAPQLFPDKLAIETFITELPMVLELEEPIRHALNQASDMVALCHWNLNLDNAWFVQSTDGSLRAGMLDWGSVGQMNIAQSFFGLTCAAEPDFLAQHERDLVERFVERYAQSGGPAISPDRMHDFVKLSMAVLGTAWMLDAPSIIARELPHYADAKDRFDPILTDHFLARTQHHLLSVFIAEWTNQNIGGTLRRFAKDRHF